MTLFAVMAMGIGTGQAHQMLYDQDGYRLAVGIEAGLGGFLVGNVDTGRATLIQTRPLKGRFPLPCGAPRGNGLKDLANPLPSWKRRFSVSGIATLSSAWSGR